jgi:hypothetical protein
MMERTIFDVDVRGGQLVFRSEGKFRLTEQQLEMEKLRFSIFFPDIATLKAVAKKEADRRGFLVGEDGRRGSGLVGNRSWYLL